MLLIAAFFTDNRKKAGEMMLRVILELFRIITIIFVIGMMMGLIIHSIYAIFGITVENTTGGWIVGMAIFPLLYVLYKQYSGFYKNGKQVKLSNRTTTILLCFSVLMLTVAPLFR
ncbi:hypothetical protein [Peribacillus frigoritolerans]|uniref:hypothetical protein n=1 Tax=Peribacillus frigoritolerans TaxID=450367 RepID=UPI00207AB4C7|nr:hypothetical protein [Peribacillus frigoritolerans]USK73954.1 hypothetical protein LIT31_19350 [Peribacillus frigoritolerans]